MFSKALTLGLIAVIPVILASCTSRPDYDIWDPTNKSVEAYEAQLKEKAQVSKPLPVGGKFKKWEGTKLEFKDNRDVAALEMHTPFVTKYDPVGKTNIGPGHVRGKTKWDKDARAEISNKEGPGGHVTYKDESGKEVHTHYSYVENCDVGPNHILKKTKFSREAKREIVPDDYEAGVTKWCPICKEEMGPGHDHGFTRYCPNCQKDVAAFGHVQQGEIHYGHDCNLTEYSLVWAIDMFRKDAKTYEVIPSSKNDYADLDKAYAPDHQPRISEPEADLLDVPVPWVEDRKVKLSHEDIDRLNWKWSTPKAKEVMYKFAERVLTDVAKEVRAYIDKIEAPDHRWEKDEDEDTEDEGAGEGNDEEDK